MIQILHPTEPKGWKSLNTGMMNVASRNSKLYYASNSKIRSRYIYLKSLLHANLHKDSKDGSFTRMSAI